MTNCGCWKTSVKRRVREGEKARRKEPRVSAGEVMAVLIELVEN